MPISIKELRSSEEWNHLVNYVNSVGWTMITKEQFNNLKRNLVITSYTLPIRTDWGRLACTNKLKDDRRIAHIDGFYFIISQSPLNGEFNEDDIKLFNEQYDTITQLIGDLADFKSTLKRKERSLGDVIYNMLRDLDFCKAICKNVQKDQKIQVFYNDFSMNFIKVQNTEYKVTMFASPSNKLPLDNINLADPDSLLQIRKYLVFMKKFTTEPMSLINQVNAD